MIRIAVISDTHDHVPAGLPARLAAADEIWHLGDVCEAGHPGEVRGAGPAGVRRARQQRGARSLPLDRRLEREGHRFFLTHIPPRRTPVDADVVLHGHTHVPRDETDAQGIRWLNPGCIARPNRGAPPSFAWLLVEKGKPPVWRLERV
ncbi:MAG: metallophosphoesterase family protein [Lacunisphaera sp.]